MTAICQKTIQDGRFLAKDRHLIERLQASSHPKDQARLARLLTQSRQSVQARCDSVPPHLKDTLNADLPVVHCATRLIQAIKDHQVIIVAGETGSGKTTQLPKLALLAGRGITGQIGHTQPRRLAARSVAVRIADELGEPLGKTVSFKVRFSEEGGRHALIKLMTDGILLAELSSDRYLTRYDTLIIDEAHERSLTIDFLLGYIKQLLPKRPDLKVIITSATLDTDRFAQYFAKDGTPAPIFTVEGRSYPVDIRYRPILDYDIDGSDDDAFDELEDKLPNALLLAVQECLDDGRRTKGAGDILIFAATERGIRDLYDHLVGANLVHTDILMLYARQSFAEQNKIFTPSNKRRIIIATNVAETALTVPNIGYVIDLGFARISRYCYRSRIQRLPIVAISQAAANQRAGRAGRVADGVCIRLYAKSDFDSRPKFTEPEILRTNLASVILQMAALKLGDVADFDFITPPDFRLVNDGKKLLYELSAITQMPTKTAQKKRQDHAITLTKVGKTMAKMPIDPRLARMLVAAFEFDCVAQMLVIVSALAVQDIRERPEGKQAQADQKHALFRGEGSDFLFYLNVYEAVFGKSALNGFCLLSSSGKKAFAKKHFLNYARIREWQKTHDQLSDMLSGLGLLKSTASSVTSLGDNDGDALQYAHIHQALLSALLSFVAQKTQTKEYLLVKQQKAYIFPASVLHKKTPAWLMAFEVVQTTNTYLRTNAKIEPEWILTAAKPLLKYHYFEPHWSKKQGRVRAYAQISLFGLIIVHKQLVNYEVIDPKIARKIFIEEALVNHQLGVSLPFLVHNNALLKKVMALEDQYRRRDLLVSDGVLCDFYEQVLPQHVASRKALQTFVATNDTECLHLTQTMVLNDTSLQDDFPKSWQVGSLTLPLSYVFDPSSQDDGVSVRVPKSALPQLDATALLWGVGAWRGELVTALLKTLPKEARRALLPIPDTAKTLMEKLRADHQTGLLQQLSDALVAYGLRVSPEQFELEQLPKYLRPLVCVVDDKGVVIDKDRDVKKLQLRHVSLPQTVNSGRYDSYPKDFVFVREKQLAGAKVPVFFALTADETWRAVDIVENCDFYHALDAHKKGVLVLIQNALGSKKRQITAQLDNATKLAYAPFGDLEQLKQMFTFAVLSYGFDELDPIKQPSPIRQILPTTDDAVLARLPLTYDEFLVLKSRLLGRFLSDGQTVLSIFKAVFTEWQHIRQKLLMLDLETFADNRQDIEDQLDDLLLGEFAYKVASTHWRHYPRYLSALKVRLERLSHNIEADTQAVYALDKHMERIAERLTDRHYSEYRWLLEEYRINLFAQPMKTLVPVSEKRLDKLWQQLNA